MYELFFGLRERPFSLRPDPAFLYLSHQHSLALSMLEFSLTGQAGFVVVTGEIGSGKTTLIRHFLRQAERSTTIGLVSNTHPGMGEILPWVLHALNIEPKSSRKSACHQALLRYLEQEAAAGRRVVLIVDEAQNLSVAALEALRLLSNLDLDKETTLQIALVAQPELLEKLRRPDIRQFAQRISVHYHLMPLSYAESCGYIRHRLAVAGANQEIFDRLAMGAVYYFSGGVPRLMNSICDMAMVYGYAAGKSAIDLDLIVAVVCDREKHGVQVLAKRAEDISRAALTAAIEQRFGEPCAEQLPCGITATSVERSDRSVEDVNGPLDGLLQVEHQAADDDTCTRADTRASAPNGHNGASPPVTAFYLADDVSYQGGAATQGKLNALKWLRRHLAADRGQP